MRKYYLLFIIFISLILFSGCAPKNRCVNVYYFHAENGFSKGLYLLTGKLYDLNWGMISRGMVLDTKWADRESSCNKEDRANLEEAWYSVHFPDGEILYGTGGVSGIVYVNGYSVRSKTLVGKTCYGFGCKRKVIKEEEK